MREKFYYIIVSTMFSGFNYDIGNIGLSVCFGFITFILLAVIIINYLDDGVNSIDADNKGNKP